MYDRTRFKYSAWSILVRAYPTILMSLGRNLFRYCGRWLMHSPNHASNNDAPSTYQAEECGELNISQLAAISPLRCIDGLKKPAGREGQHHQPSFSLLDRPKHRGPRSQYHLWARSSWIWNPSQNSGHVILSQHGLWDAEIDTIVAGKHRDIRAGGPALENLSWTRPVGAQRDAPGLRQNGLLLSIYFFVFATSLPTAARPSTAMAATPIT